LVIYSRFSRSYNFLFRFNYSNAIHSTLILSVFWKNSTIQKNKKQRKFYRKCFLFFENSPTKNQLKNGVNTMTLFVIARFKNCYLFLDVSKTYSIL
jgi:hypothetical protein